MSTTTTVPGTIEAIDLDTMNELVGDSLGDGTVTGFRADRIGEGVGMMGELHRVELDVDAGDGTAPRHVIVKQPGRDEGARFIAQTFGFYAREVAFYTSMADAPIRTPKCLAAHHDPATDDFVIVLEDLGHLRAADQISGCSLADARTVIEAIAAFHAHYWEPESRPAVIPGAWESPNPEGFHHLMTTSWPAFQERFPGRLPTPVADAVGRMPEVVHELFEPREFDTISHGDFRLDNMFFDDDGVVVLDWQLMTQTSAARDIGYFLSQSLTVDDRRRYELEFLDTYRAHLAAAGIDYPAGQLWDDYRRAVLFCIAIPVAGGVTLDFSNDRAVTLFDTMIDRVVTAITDLDAVATMP